MDKVFKLKEKFNPVFYKKNGTTVIMWDYEPSMNEGSELPYGYCYQHIFSHKATQDEINSFIDAFYNKQTGDKILSGLTINDKLVWLSAENQMNYQSMFNLAIQTKGASLPETVKLGDENSPVYYKITTLEEMTEFYTKVHKHIQSCLQEGWEKKTKAKQ